MTEFHFCIAVEIVSVVKLFTFRKLLYTSKMMFIPYELGFNYPQKLCTGFSCGSTIKIWSKSVASTGLHEIVTFMQYFT